MLQNGGTEILTMRVSGEPEYLKKVLTAPFCQLLIFKIYPASTDTELVVKDCLQI